MQIQKLDLNSNFSPNRIVLPIRFYILIHANMSFMDPLHASMLHMIQKEIVETFSS